MYVAKCIVRMTYVCNYIDDFNLLMNNLTTNAEFIGHFTDIYRIGILATVRPKHTLSTKV